MPKVKLPRSSPSIDMTPMVDLAFLLVTFFMLTTKFRAQEAVQVTIPASVSTTKVSDNATTISIDSNGRVFFDMDGKDMRAQLIQDISAKYPQIGALTPDEILRFSLMGAFGVPMANLKQYIDATESERKALSDQNKGIPTDSIPLNELEVWVKFGWNVTLQDWSKKKAANPKEPYPPYDIKADGMAKYKIVKKVIDICQKANIEHFDLVTSMKVKSK